MYDLYNESAILLPQHEVHDRNDSFFECFPYVCPEPVLVK